MLPDDRAGGVEVDAGDHFGGADPGADLADRTEEPEGGGELVPTIVEHEDAAATTHLLELPFVAAQRDVPAAPATAHHLEVITGDVPELTGLHDRPTDSLLVRAAWSDPVSHSVRARVDP